MMKLKKRTFLILMAALTATFASAQKQPLPEWQSQYAVGLNKLAPHTYVWPYADASDIEKPGGYEQYAGIPSSVTFSLQRAYN